VKDALQDAAFMSDGRYRLPAEPASVGDGLEPAVHAERRAGRRGSKVVGRSGLEPIVKQ
jgi:hypothetical protein